MDIRNAPRRTPILMGQSQTSVFNRITAKAIDLLVILAIFFLASAFFKPFGIFAAAIYAALQDGMGVGQSVGKRIIGLRVIDDGTGIGCSYQESIFRNFPLALGVVCASLSVFWIFFILLCVPALGLELYLLFSLESGVRLGDVLGNTLVVEYVDSQVETVE